MIDLAAEHEALGRVRSAFPFVVVTGGKGGVGKTTIAANLGVALSLRGCSTLLVDLDFGLGDLALALGLEPERTLEHALDGRAAFEDCVSRGPIGLGGLRVLAADRGSPHMARPDARRRALLLAGLGRLAQPDALVVGDGAAGIGADVLAFSLAAERVLVVTTPEPAALADAYGTIKALDHAARELGIEIATPEIFVNLASDAGEAHGVAAHLREVCERFLSRAPRLSGWLPRSRAVLASCSTGVPFVCSDASGLASRAMLRLAGRYDTLAQGSRALGADPALKASAGHDR